MAPDKESRLSTKTYQLLETSRCLAIKLSRFESPVVPFATYSSTKKRAKDSGNSSGITVATARAAEAICSSVTDVTAFVDFESLESEPSDKFTFGYPPLRL